MDLLIIFPCYNEEAVLSKSITSFFKYFEGLVNNGTLSSKSSICFVDDGSSDATWDIIKSFPQKNVLGVKLSTNFGHQKALLAGLETFSEKFEGFLTMDVDLQDDFTVLPKMIEAVNAGNDIVYGVREDRSTDSFFKRFTANAFYWVFKKLGVKSIKNAADFRLINQKALSAFLHYKESHLFLRAVFPSIGLTTTNVYYSRKKRTEGDTKYPFSKMVSFAWEGITSFSTRPLKWVLFIGICTTFIALGLFLWAFIQLVLGNTIRGWFSVMAILLFFGGLQTLALGVIGEYIGKIYQEVKKRPRYIIDEIKSQD